MPNEGVNPGSSYEVGGDRAGDEGLLRVQRVKVHPRCVKSQNHLRWTVNTLCSGHYIIEMRHNMYIIITMEPLDEGILVRLRDLERRSVY